jgi:hypothetical protein
MPVPVLLDGSGGNMPVPVDAVWKEEGKGGQIPVPEVEGRGGQMPLPVVGTGNILVPNGEEGKGGQIPVPVAVVGRPVGDGGGGGQIPVPVVKLGDEGRGGKISVAEDTLGEEGQMPDPVDSVSVDEDVRVEISQLVCVASVAVLELETVLSYRTSVYLFDFTLAEKMLD